MPSRKDGWAGCYELDLSHLGVPAERCEGHCFSVVIPLLSFSETVP